MEDDGKESSNAFSKGSLKTEHRRPGRNPNITIIPTEVVQPDLTSVVQRVLAQKASPGEGF